MVLLQPWLTIVERGIWRMASFTAAVVLVPMIPRSFPIPAYSSDRTSTCEQVLKSEVKNAFWYSMSCSITERWL